MPEGAASPGAAGRFVSYAQNFEDVMLWRALKGEQPGGYVDVGAQHPVTDSVSLAFYQRGWRGVHVEPSPDFAHRLREARPGEVVIEAAAGRTGGEIAFYDMAESGFGTCVAGVAARHADAGRPSRERRVRAVRLDDVLEACPARPLHWLKIDVEGAEADVLAGWERASPRPWIVVVESVHPLDRADTRDAWEAGLVARGYRFAWFDGLNRFYVADEHAERLAAFAGGPNVFDDFVLSGTASAPFCALLRDEIEKLNEQLALCDQRMEEQRLRLVEYGHNLRRWHNADREAWATEQAETARYVASLQEAAARAEAYARSLEEERVRLEARLRAVAGGAS